MEHIRKLGCWLLPAAVAAVIAGWGLDKIELNGHECYVGLAARGMNRPGQWLDDNLAERPVPEATTLNRWMVPQCNGEPRLRKTPLAYWAVAGLMKMGLPDDEVTVRLPSVVASVLTVLVMFGVGRRMVGNRAAVMGALMLGASIGTLKWGRNARPELLLMLWMTAAMACFWLGMQAATGVRRAIWLLAGWAAMGLANLSKEFVPLFLVWPLLAYLAWRSSMRRDERPRRRLEIFVIAALAGIVLLDVMRRFEALQWWQSTDLDPVVCSALTYAGLIGLPLAGYFLTSRPWGQLKLVLPTLLPGLVLMSLLFMPWLVYLDRLFPATSDTLWHQVGARGVGSDGWTSLRTPGFYLASIISLTLPWIIFLPGAVLAPLWSAPARRPETEASQQPAEHVDGLVYLFFWVFGLTLLFSAAAGKRVHYILPAVPALCMLAGYAAEDVFFRHRWFSLRQARWIMGGYAVLGVLTAGVVALAIYAASDGWIARTFARVLEAVEDRVSPGKVADIGRHFFVPIALVAAALLAGTLAMMRSKPTLSFAALVAAAAILLFSLAGRPELVNEAPHATHEVRWIRSKAPVSAPISFWGHNQREEPLVYYFGHDLPNAELARQAMTARYGKEEGLRRWEAWMRKDGGRWLLVRAEDVDEVKAMGYTIVDDEHRPKDADMDVILFQPPAGKKDRDTP